MTRPLKIKIIAGFLLLVFSLNSLAGFACSLGVDMGYNRDHHKHHRHHHISSVQNMKHGDAGFASYIIEHKGTDDCCAGSVTGFAKLDKSTLVNNWLLPAPVFLLTHLILFVWSAEPGPGPAVNSCFQFVRRSCFLNDTDIHIYIRSFLI